ncbi:MAG: F0F1 ATP synthase subunit gamma [Candidatus Cloacimonadaceae bacterium]
MSESTNSLHRKMQSAADLQSVVRTMKDLAASSIGQYEKSVLALADYYHTLERGLSVCFWARGLEPILSDSKNQPLAAETVAIVFGSDQGLVGQFNDVIADYAIAALSAMPGKPQVWVVGERVHESLVEAGLQVMGLFPVPNSIGGVTSLVGQILIESQSHRHREINNEFFLYYNSPTTGAGYTPYFQQLLPFSDEWRSRISKLPWNGKNLPEVMGDLTTTLQTLISEYLFVSIFRACAESLASENTSRLAAMQRADKNIDELLEDLNSSFHRLRQSDIDEELFDVISGYEALGKSR